MKISLVAMATLALAHISIPLPAADKLPAFNSIRTAGPDFSVQGEYVGTVGGTHPIPAQPHSGAPPIAAGGEGSPATRPKKCLHAL